MYGTFLHYNHCVSQADMICTGENYKNVEIYILKIKNIIGFGCKV
jgi:hypothetical protein